MEGTNGQNPEKDTKRTLPPDADKVDFDSEGNQRSRRIMPDGIISYLSDKEYAEEMQNRDRSNSHE